MLVLLSLPLRWLLLLLQGKEKFLEQFIGEDDDEDQQQQQQEQDAAAAAAAGLKTKKGPQKPAEHRALFRGNLDDHFRWDVRLMLVVGLCACMCCL
jgi:hypothetical protein